MSGGAPTIGGLKRLTYDPINDNFGDLIAGQFYWSINFTGGEIQNVLLKNCTFSPPVTGGGGYQNEIKMTSGTSVNVPSVGTMVLINSAASGAKTVHIPAATGSKGIITIFDFAGTADPLTGGAVITAVPASGSITGNNQVYTNNGSITLEDSSLGWISI
jgi:hypothetical protein